MNRGINIYLLIGVYKCSSGYHHHKYYQHNHRLVQANFSVKLKRSW